MAVGTMTYELSPDDLRKVLRNKPEKTRQIIDTSRRFLDEGALSGVTSEDLDALDTEFNPPPPPVVPPPSLFQRLTRPFPPAPEPEVTPGAPLSAVEQPTPPFAETIDAAKRLIPSMPTLPVTSPEQQAANEQAMAWERGPIVPPVVPPVMPPIIPPEPPPEDAPGLFGRAMERISQGQREAAIGQKEVARPVLDRVMGPDPFVGPIPEPVEREPELRSEPVPAAPPILPRLQEALSPTGLTATPEQAKQASAAQASLDVTARERGETPYDFVQRTTRGREDFLERMLNPQQIKAGAIGTTTSMLGAVPWLEGLVGIETPAGRISQEAVDALQNHLRRYQIGDPGFIDAIPSGLGSMALFMVPGMGATAAITRMSTVAPRLALWAGAGVSSIMEAASEAGDTYQTVRSSGKGEQAAVQAANDVFAKNMVLIPVTEKLGIFGETGGLVRRALMGATMEGAQEFGQYVIQQRAQGEPFDLGQALTAAGVGAVVGGAAGPVMGMALERPEPPATVTGEAVAGPPLGIQPPSLTLGQPPMAPPPAEIQPGIPPTIPPEPTATPPKRRYLVTSDDGRVGTIIVGREGQAAFFEVTNSKSKQRYTTIPPDVTVPSDAFNEVFPARELGMSPDVLQENRFRFLSEEKIPAQKLARTRFAPPTPPPTMAEAPAGPTPEFPVMEGPLFPPAGQPYVSRREEPTAEVPPEIPVTPEGAPIPLLPRTPTLSTPANVEGVVSEAIRLAQEAGDIDQINTGALIDAFRRTNGDPVAASQIYFATKDDTAPAIARNLAEFRAKTQQLATFFRTGEGPAVGPEPPIPESVPLATIPEEAPAEVPTPAPEPVAAPTETPAAPLEEVPLDQPRTIEEWNVDDRVSWTDRQGNVREGTVEGWNDRDQSLSVDTGMRTPQGSRFVIQIPLNLESLRRLPPRAPYGEPAVSSTGPVEQPPEPQAAEAIPAPEVAALEPSPTQEMGEPLKRPVSELTTLPEVQAMIDQLEERWRSLPQHMHRSGIATIYSIKRHQLADRWNELSAATEEPAASALKPTPITFSVGDRVMWRGLRGEPETGTVYIDDDPKPGRTMVQRDVGGVRGQTIRRIDTNYLQKVEPTPAPATTPSQVEQEAAAISDADLDALIDERIAAKTGEPAPAPQESTTAATPPATEPPPPLLDKITSDAARALDEGLKGLQELFGMGPGAGLSMSMGLPQFSEETYQRALPHFRASWAATKELGGDLKAFIDRVLDQVGPQVKPYLKRFIQTPTDWSPEGHVDVTPPSPASVTPSEVPLTPSYQLASWVRDRLYAHEPIAWQNLFTAADQFFGGTQAEGGYTPKDAYDAMEMGVNLFVTQRPTGDLTQAQTDVLALKQVEALLPTQSKRTLEQEAYQQFSTPPHEAYAVAWVGNVQAGEQVSEPSAGTGDLAVFARNAGADVVVNELDPRRADLLRQMGFERVFTEDAEQLHNILPPDVQPTLVLMNPPFSTAAGRMGNRRATMAVTQHLEQALKRLQPNGRLVALVGRGMAEGMPTFMPWWQQIKREYDVRANIGLPGSEYQKYGTTFDHQLVVIDKRGPTPPGGTVTASVGSLAEALPLLEDIRNDRVPVAPRPREPATSEPTRDTTTSQGGAAPGPVPGGPAATPGVGSRGGRGPSSRPTPVTPGQPGGAPGGTPTGGVGLPLEAGIGGPGERGGSVTGERPGTPGGVPRPGVSPEAPTGEPTITTEQQAPQVGTGPDSAMTSAVYEPYAPQKLMIPGAQPHPGKLVQSAAMATVDPPDPTYTPRLPQTITGKLSIAQLEAITYAGQAHEQMLPNETRKGFFVGDGTGVGKGREIAGIILDNFAHGRRKAVWVSVNSKLFRDAQRDFGDTGGDVKKLFELSKVNAGAEIKTKDGVLYTTYGTLKSAAKQTRDASGTLIPGKKRLDQLVEWLGADFDGALVFDESHMMANSLDQRGARGVQSAAQQAIAGLALQTRLPNARVVYVSATGATEVRNLAYAARLGLWGRGTAFPDVQTFVSNIQSGGLAAMELVARDLKARGLYLARNLSFEDVTYETLEHPLTPEQSEIYNTLAESWQIVLRNVNQALEDTDGAKNGRAKSSAMSAFWSAHQRFFNQIITSMQMPSAVARIRQDIEDRPGHPGEAVVLQLVNTNEAIQERRLAAMEDDLSSEALEGLDLTPRENLMQYLQNSFPTQQYEEYVDDQGNTQYRPVNDAHGNPVENADAVAAREALLDRLGAIRVPEGPLEIILNQFGPDMVAEVTGRSRRVVRIRDAEGERTEVQRRGEAAALTDARAFMQDKKRILVFSDAGGTGQSYHAALTSENQRHRQHYLIQPGWRADRAVQGMGRTHRTNEASAPNYVLVTTDLKGQKRFLSSVARRLDQLGALTKGQRQTGSQGLFSARDNLESQYAQDAMQQFWRELYRGRIGGLDFGEITNAMGLDLIDRQSGSLKAELPPVTQFLNRILSLDITRQNQVFDAFFSRVEEQVAAAMAAGTLDVGVETIQALRTEVVSEQTVYVDPDSGAETHYVHLQLTHPQKFNEFLDKDPWPGFEGYFLNTKSGRVSDITMVGQQTLESGALVNRYRSRSPTSFIFIDEAALHQPHMQQLTNEDAARLWQDAIAQTPPTYTEELHILTGALLPIWDRVPGSTRVVRVQTADGRRLLGRYIAPRDLRATLDNLGANASAPQITPAEAIAKILDERYTVRLANGWSMKQSRVSGEPRIELVGPEYNDLRILTDEGVFTERIQWQTRYFIPTGDTAATVFATVTRYRPVVAVEPPVRTAADVLAAQRGAEGGGTPDVSAFDIPQEPTPEPTTEPAPETGPATHDATMIPQSERRALQEGTAEVAPKLSQILNDLQTALNLPIRPGRLRRSMKRLRVGQYTPHTRIMRLRTSNDVEVASHEIGHYLEDRLDVHELTNRFERELTYLAPPGYPPNEERREGFAEFVRLYITQEDQARTAMPAAFYDAFDELLREQAPLWHDALRRAREAYTQFSEASPSARIGAVLSAGRPKRQSKGIPYWWHEFYRAVLEDIHWVKVARDLMAQGQPLTPSDDAYVLGRLIRGVNGKIGNMVRHGMIRYGDLRTRVSKGLPEILDAWGEDLAKGDQSVLRRYLVARGGLEAITNEKQRAAEMSMKTGAPVTPRVMVPFTEADAMRTITQLEVAHPQLLTTFAELRAFEDAGLAYLRDAGMLSDQSFETIRAMHHNHVPLYRVMEESTPLDVSAFGGTTHVGTGEGGTKFADISSPIRRRKGSGRDIIDPLESVIKNTYAFVAAADRNAVMQALIRQAEGVQGFGELIEPLPTPMTPTTADIARIRDDLEAAGIEIPTGAEDAMVSIWQPNYHPQRPNAVWVWREGTRHLYQLAPELYRSVEALDQESVQQWVRFISAPAHMLRLGATQLSPSFMIRNPIRDPQSGWINAGWAVPKGFVSMIQTVLSPGRGQRLQELYNAWELSGSAQASRVSMDRASLQEDLASLLRRGHLKQQTLHALKHPVSTLRYLSDLSELQTRLDIFAGSLGSGGLNTATTNDLLRAGFASREGTLDFARHGATLAAVRHMTAFLGANIQGIDKTARVLFTEGTVQDRAMAWLRAFAGITLPSIIMWAINADDDRYRNLPQWLKDTCWLIPIGSYFVPIPKPPIVGQFFGSSVERFLDWVTAKDPQALHELVRAIIRGVDFAWVPTALGPIMENWANRSLFFDRPIVPRALESVLPQEQSALSTSDTARLTARLFGPLADVTLLGQLSAPAKLENLIIGYTGGLGRIGLQAGDAMLHLLGLGRTKVQPSPNVPWGDIPVLSSITRTVMVPTAPTLQSPQLERFYTALEDARRYETTIRALIKDGRTEDAVYLLHDPSSTTVQLSTLEQAEKFLHARQSRMHQIYSSSTMTRDEKRRQIDEITAEMNDLAGRALQYTQGQTGSRPPYKRVPRSLPPAMGQ